MTSVGCRTNVPSLVSFESSFTFTRGPSLATYIFQVNVHRYKIEVLAPVEHYYVAIININLSFVTVWHTWKAMDTHI
jgi:hypothetical protein